MLAALALASSQGGTAGGEGAVSVLAFDCKATHMLAGTVQGSSCHTQAWLTASGGLLESLLLALLTLLTMPLPFLLLLDAG